MHIHILVAGNRPPDWVARGCEDYLKRLPAAARPRIQRLPPARRGRGAGTSAARDAEGKRMLAVLPDRAHVVALDVAGSPWSSAQLSKRLMRWQRDRQDVYLLIGGSDGLASACLERAQERWSLGPLTLPHTLIQVVLAEALYRAWSVTQGHPYHR
jgi:23S rRNA (pseudouridine1915-N3)-methyltransferase